MKVEIWNILCFDNFFSWLKQKQKIQKEEKRLPRRINFSKSCKQQTQTFPSFLRGTQAK